MVLKLFGPGVEETVPKGILDKIANEKIYIKFIEVYVLEDFLEMLFKLADLYPNAFVDTNGLQIPEKLDLKYIKLIDKETKIYHKSRSQPDI